jgi:para-nitrobenzyl esterase
LYLNVIAPKGKSNHPLPVMFWIHGGGFSGGEGAGYDGTALVEASGGNVIYVSINYRLGVLGFLAHTALGLHSGNYGLQDQQLAMRWVQQNISAFGGDPHHVTIFGESAGGSSICHQLASPTAAGLFQAAISQSGQYNAITAQIPAQALQLQDCKVLATQAQANAAGVTFAKTVGCGSAADVAACLRSVPASTVRATPGTASPIVDGATLVQQPRTAFATGNFNRVKTVIGVLQDENLLGSPATVADYEALVRSIFGKHASDVLELYPVDQYDNPYIAFREVAADSSTVCSALETVENIARWTPVFAYQIDDTDAPLLSAFYPSSVVSNGSYHAADLAMLFPGSPVFPDMIKTADMSQNQQVLSRQMMAYWTTFARTGNPTATATPVWPQYNNQPVRWKGSDKPVKQMVMSLQPAGDSHATPADAIWDAHNCDFWDKLWHEGD